MKNLNDWQWPRRIPVRAIFAAVPVVLVNVVAFAGQLAFLREHLPWTLAGQILMAVTLESIAVYLAWQAHLAALANDSALRLRLAAYGFAAVIAAMNYSHYAGPGWSPTFAAVAVALCSAASPWLWGIHTRRVSRDQLMAAGLIEPHALRLGATRWFWHAYRSVRVMKAATWRGETDPAKAISAVYPVPVRVPARVPAAKRETVRDVSEKYGVRKDTVPKMKAYAATKVREALAAQNGDGHS
jgi:hypothetical protein